MDLTLRTQADGDSTVGVMTAGPLELRSIELGWHDNRPDVSCVPAGEYTLIPYDSPKHGPTWCLHNHLLGVTADGADDTRARCEIHSANWASQLEGCIALGLDHQPMVNPATGRIEPAVERSRDAIAELLALLEPLSIGHTLTIVRE